MVLNSPLKFETLRPLSLSPKKKKKKEKKEKGLISFYLFLDLYL